MITTESNLTPFAPRNSLVSPQSGQPGCVKSFDAARRGRLCRGELNSSSKKHTSCAPRCWWLPSRCRLSDSTATVTSPVQPGKSRARTGDPRALPNWAVRVAAPWPADACRTVLLDVTRPLPNPPIHAFRSPCLMRFARISLHTRGSQVRSQVRPYRDRGPQATRMNTGVTPASVPKSRSRAALGISPIEATT